MGVVVSADLRVRRGDHALGHHVERFLNEHQFAIVRLELLHGQIAGFQSSVELRLVAAKGASLHVIELGLNLLVGHADAERGGFLGNNFIRDHVVENESPEVLIPSGVGLLIGDACPVDRLVGSQFRVEFGLSDLDTAHLAENTFGQGRGRATTRGGKKHQGQNHRGQRGGWEPLCHENLLEGSERATECGAGL